MKKQRERQESVGGSNREGEVGVRRTMCYAVGVCSSKRQDPLPLNPWIIVCYVWVLLYVVCVLFTEKNQLIRVIHLGVGLLWLRCMFLIHYKGLINCLRIRLGHLHYMFRSVDSVVKEFRTVFHSHCHKNAHINR